MHTYPKISLISLERLLQKRFEEDGFLTLKDLPPPTLFKDIEKATDRIIQAIDNKEKIVLIGDYDVDGVVSTVLMKFFFEKIGVGLEWIIPNRFKDGYGLSPTIIQKIEGFDLAVTVDNGISAVTAAQMCQDSGIDLIITDHHLLPTLLPSAYAIINPKQKECNFPYSDICGAQIAWYLIASLNRRLSVQIDIKSYLELVAIAIIADMMPLKHINRAMVLSGINLLGQSRQPYIKAFKEHLNKEHLESEDISFQLAPILNSAGRLEDASLAVEFLLSRNIYDARSRLSKLVILNDLRKEIEQEITQQAISKADKSHAVLVIHGEEWHEGVVGIVAARVARHFGKPSIILTDNKEGNIKGSGRSIGVCDLFEITKSCDEYLLKFGGHQAAIGLMLQRNHLELFRSKLQENYLKKAYIKSPSDPEIVGELDFAEITTDLTALIKRFEPYGQDNPRPKFITGEVSIVQMQKMGKTENHQRFLFEHDGVLLSGVRFNSNVSYPINEKVTLSYRLHENCFRGKVSLQIIIEDIIFR